ncbi:MAG TPA: hypothetical protein VKT27_01945 [Candidatus Binataceae bacterium]|nr:hypothetical protein [Candidatus Binataceae bacterium]
MSSHPHAKTLELLRAARELVARAEHEHLTENERAEALAVALLRLDTAIETLQSEWGSSPQTR